MDGWRLGIVWGMRRRIGVARLVLEMVGLLRDGGRVFSAGSE